MKINRPLFWNSINLISILLYPLSLVTFFINILKKTSYKKEFKIKTICIGNLYVGGTGKTPLSIMINKILRKNYKTVFIKKKYYDQIDEQRILKLNGNLICKSNRKEALEIFSVEIQTSKYNIKIACFNSSDGLGNNFLIPAGPLRENATEIKNYDAIFLNGENKNKKLFNYFKKINRNIKIFEAKYVPTNLRTFNRNSNFLFFCGLGNPLEFEKTLKKYKFRIKDKFIYPDHYNFSDSDISDIKMLAKRENLKIITTEKDYLRLSKKNRKNIKFLKIDLNVKNIKNFSKFLLERL